MATPNRPESPPRSIRPSTRTASFGCSRGDAPQTSRPEPLAGTTLSLVEEGGPPRAIAAARASSHLSHLTLNRSGNYAAYLTRVHVVDATREIFVARAQLALGKLRESNEPDPAERAPVFDPAMPLDLVRERIPDETFYTRLVLTVRAHGAPTPDVPVTLTTQQGWRKTVISGPDGRATFTLIREDFPSWTSAFRRSSWSAWLASAERIEAAPGSLGGRPIHAPASTPAWPGRTYPAASDYRSLAIGLGIVTAMTLVGGAGVFLYRERRAHPFREDRFDDRA